MKINKLYIIIIVCFLCACDKNTSPFYNEILKSETGQLRGIEISTTIEDVKKVEAEQFLRDKMLDYLHYDYEISMGNTYTVTYDFSEDNELYEIEVAVFLDVVKDASLLFDNFSNHFNKKHGVGRNEADGYMTWHTNSSISSNRVAISIINDSESYGYITILIRDLDY